MNIDLFFSDENNKKKSQKQEKRIAKSVGGKTTIGSGCLGFSKGDVYVDKVRIECKRTDKSSIRVEKDWFNKLIEQCKLGEIPVLNVEIQDQNWFLVRKEEFSYILNKLKEEQYGDLGKR